LFNEDLSLQKWLRSLGRVPSTVGRAPLTGATVSGPNPVAVGVAAATMATADKEASDRKVAEEAAAKEAADTLAVEEAVTKEAANKKMAEEATTKEAADKVVVDKQAAAMEAADKKSAEEATDKEAAEEATTKEVEDKKVGTKRAATTSSSTPLTKHPYKGVWKPRFIDFPVFSFLHLVARLVFH
jgi:hypothetical protein